MGSTGETGVVRIFPRQNRGILPERFAGNYSSRPIYRPRCHRKRQKSKRKKFIVSWFSLGCKLICATAYELAQI